MTLETPLWQQPSVGDPDIPYTAQQNRVLFDVMAFLPGVTLKNDLKVSQRSAGANLSVDVAAGSAFIPGTSVAYQGKYLCRSTATVNVPLVGGVPGSGTRGDLIVAQVFDDQADGSGQYSWSPVWVPGTTTAPANSIPLAKVTVASGISSILNASINDSPRLLSTLGDVPAFELTGGNGQSLAHNTNVPYTGWSFSDLIGCDTTGNAGEIKVRLPGRYQLTWTQRVDHGGVLTTERTGFIQQSGSKSRRVGAQSVYPGPDESAAGSVVTCSGTARCAAGDTLRAFTYQFSNATLHLSDAFSELTFAGYWVGP